jgi:hypothetical protein
MIRRTQTLTISFSIIFVAACGNDAELVGRSGNLSSAVDKRASGSADSTIDPETVDQHPIVHDDSVALVKTLDLDAVYFAGIRTNAEGPSLGAYMASNNLNYVLLEFCKPGAATCQMTSRDFSKTPIAGGSNFAVVGVRTEATAPTNTVPDYVKFDDHQTNNLNSYFLETVGPTTLPYFVLVFRGQSTQGVVWRQSIETTLYNDIRTSVEALIN